MLLIRFCERDAGQFRDEIYAHRWDTELDDGSRRHKVRFYDAKLSERRTKALERLHHTRRVGFAGADEHVKVFGRPRIERVEYE